MNKSEPAPTPGPSPVRKNCEQGRGDSLPVSGSFPTGEGLGRGQTLLLQRLLNLFQHRVNVVKHIVVRKSDDTIILLLVQPPRPFCVVCGPIRVGVNVAIYLNHQFGFGAKEVHDEAAHCVLLADMRAAYLPVADELPESLFGRRHFLAELPGTNLHWSGSTPAFMRRVLHE